jgi:tRNA 5-methylaminomethyl-2-thiouridine biosynthesis bifunctional protein
MDAGDLAPGLRLLPVRGQASWAAGATLSCAVTWGGYAVPCDGGVLFGATHDRGCSDRETRPADDRRNLQSLAQVLPALAATIADSALIGRAAVRAATPDFMPLAGPVGGQTGLYVLGGLGSRGFTTAPLLAEHLAAVICEAPSPLPDDLQLIVDPGRFRSEVSP